jgi:8-oxo-dGTP diphosphatase
MWNLPGGKIDFGETAEEAIRKEIDEETALSMTGSRFLFYMDNLPDETTDLHFVGLFFECLYTGEIQINNESMEYRWIGMEDISMLNFAFENDKALVKYFREF